MALVVRNYTDADRPGFNHVRSRVYRSGDPVDPEENLMRPDTFGTVALLDGKIVASETDIDMSCTIRGEVVRATGVAAVGVLPEYRRGGIGLEMLSKALALYKERGSLIASLMPFRAQYYRKCGYATCGPRLSLKMPSARIPYFDPEIEVRELVEEDISPILPCYRAFASRYSGMNMRNDIQFKWQLGGDKRFAIYTAGDPVEAYIATRLKWEFWTEIEVREFAWTTMRGYRAMIGVLRGLCMNKTAVEWFEPADSPMVWRYDDQGLEVKHGGHMMYRLTDVPGVLRTIRSEQQGEFAFEVEDPAMTENQGPWKVRFGPEGTEVEKGGSPDFSIGIPALSQAVLGEPSFEAVAHQGAVDVKNRNGFDAAKRLLPPHPTYCMDFF